MKKTFTLLALTLFVAATAFAAAPDRFPTLGEQLQSVHAVPGSAFDKLIRANQDFSKLHPRDMADRIVPPWLKVVWQKAHPEVNYDNLNDPTGGYPLVLKEIVEWMSSHQDFKPGLPEANIAPGRVFGDNDADYDRDSENPMGFLNALAATAGTNVRTSGSQSAARSESDIRINFWNPNLVIAASNNISSSGTQGQYYSSDGGVTWGQTSLSLASGDAFQSDPTVDWTSTGTAYSVTMGISSSQSVLKVQAYKSTNNGVTWTFDGTVSGSQTNTDKEMIWVDHSASSAYKDNLYVIWHNGNPAYMNRRTSSGWGTPIQVSTSTATGTCIGADVKTNSAGDVFGFFPDTGSRGMFVVKSTNGGTSYGTPVKLATTYRGYDIGIPADASRRVLVYVSGGAYKNGTTNNVYALWNDLSGDSGCNSTTSEPGSTVSSTCKTRIWFARSTDGGTTWGAAAKLNNQSSNNDQFNPFLAVDETTGTIGAMYYDTVANTARTKVDVYYQMSTDGGATWGAAVKVTTAMTDETTSGADSGNQYGDYNSLSGYANKFLPSWTDRRNASYEEIWTAPITTTSTPTYSISGNAGTTGATVATTGATATSDSSSNYTLSGLANGTYTVTPTKSGCTFSPASSSVTISSANVTGVNFTASCPVTTYSISGNAGTTGATVSTSGATATSDSSSNYTLSGLANGTYTVTPSKSGCTFSPASSSVTISSANVTGVNFTASCGVTTYSISGNVGTTGATVTAGTNSTASDSSSNYAMSGFAPGSYTVTPTKTGCTFTPASTSVTISSANVTANFTASCPTGDTQLTSGVTLTGQSVAASAWKYYYITVPTGATNLTFATTAATADVDIYTLFNAKPTLTSYTCRPYTSSGNESCSATNPSAGTWWLGVYGYAAGSYSVTATVTTGTVTYSISGNAGTASATVSTTGATATSDASSNYTLGGLANGTYTVTPTKSGCTFTPASTSVTIASANVSGINFTANCGTGTTLFTDGFESTGWSTAQVSGTAGAWTLAASGTHPSQAPHGGTKLAVFNSYTSASGSQTRIYRSAGFAVASSYTSVSLKFWMYHETGYSTYADKVQVQVSTNGTTWTNVGTAVARYTGATGWAQATIDLSAYKGQTVYLGFLGISAYGNDEYLDDVTVIAQ